MCVCAMRDLKIQHRADIKALASQSELQRQTINRKGNDQKTKSPTARRSIITDGVHSSGPADQLSEQCMLNL